MSRQIPRPVHGGALRRAASHSKIPLDAWIDLSTGISPASWPVPDVPAYVWQRLPEPEDALIPAAAAYYGIEEHRLLPVPGSQWAISHLPLLCKPGPVALPRWGYAEHEYAWRQAGHTPVFYRSFDDLLEQVQSGGVAHCVLINPNNPTAELISAENLQQLTALWRNQSGTLVVDEAFMDATPQHSLVSAACEQVVVLRSVGKFFGLAGIRLGFVCAGNSFLKRLSSLLDPWAINHPARWLGAKALSDSAWQVLQRERLISTSRRWRNTLAESLPDCQWHCTPLFCSTMQPAQWCLDIQRDYLQQGLLLRVYGPNEDAGVLRIGIPAENQWERAVAILK